MKIRLHPVNIELDGDSNKSLLQICHDNKVELKSLCKGVPSCAECRVRVLAGEANLIPPNKAELSLIGTSYYIDGRRLACQIRAFGDISVDISDHLDKEDNTNKKIRGFRAQPGKTRESTAIQGTLVLQEPEAPVPVRGGATNAGGGRGGQDRGAGGGGRGQQQSRGQQTRGPSANPRGPLTANDRGQQVRHPGDNFVAGSEHPETSPTADLDGSGDEGVIDPELVDSGDFGDTSENAQSQTGAGPRPQGQGQPRGTGGGPGHGGGKRRSRRGGRGRR
jgi:2Fe-2S ferredoxin